MQTHAPKTDFAMFRNSSQKHFVQSFSQKIVGHSTCEETDGNDSHIAQYDET